MKLTAEIYYLEKLIQSHAIFPHKKRKQNCPRIRFHKLTWHIEIFFKNYTKATKYNRYASYCHIFQKNCQQVIAASHHNHD